MMSLAMRNATFDGIANPTPMLPLWPLFDDDAPALAIAQLTPMTRPLLSRSAPPELPGLIAASVWITERAMVVDAVVDGAPVLPLPSPKFQKLNGLLPELPELPELSPPLGAAAEATVMLRLSALMMPFVTVPESPSGAPMAMAMSPTLSLLESANWAGCNP